MSPKGQAPDSCTLGDRQPPGAIDWHPLLLPRRPAQPATEFSKVMSTRTAHFLHIGVGPLSCSNLGRHPKAAQVGRSLRATRSLRWRNRRTGRFLEIEPGSNPRVHVDRSAELLPIHLCAVPALRFESSWAMLSFCGSQALWRLPAATRACSFPTWVPSRRITARSGRWQREIGLEDSASFSESASHRQSWTTCSMLRTPLREMVAIGQRHMHPSPSLAQPLLTPSSGAWPRSYRAGSGQKARSPLRRTIATPHTYRP